MQKQCFLRASTTLHCFCTVSLNSYGLYNNITRLPIEKQEKMVYLKKYYEEGERHVKSLFYYIIPIL